jgi:hypothetical protein
MLTAANRPRFWRHRSVMHRATSRHYAPSNHNRHNLGRGTGTRRGLLFALFLVAANKTL